MTSKKSGPRLDNSRAEAGVYAEQPASRFETVLREVRRSPFAGREGHCCQTTDCGVPIRWFATRDGVRRNNPGWRRNLRHGRSYFQDQDSRAANNCRRAELASAPALVAGIFCAKAGRIPAGAGRPRHCSKRQGVAEPHPHDGDAGLIVEILRGNCHPAP